MAPNFATFAAALFWLLSAALSAPAGHGVQDACADVRNSSLALNREAHFASVEARDGDTSESDFSTSLAWMSETDMCDPETLRQRSSKCIVKMLEVLRNYNSYVERISGFASCSQHANRVKEPLGNLLRDVSKCVSARTGRRTERHMSTADNQDIRRSLELPLCHYTLDRLFSFSILCARVFAVGDPAHHSDGSVQKCM